MHSRTIDRYLSVRYKFDMNLDDEIVLDVLLFENFIDFSLICGRLRLKQG